MGIEYRFEGLKKFQNGIKREWLMTNGLGGYCASTVIGAHSRTHQGYLIAAQKSPSERFLFLTKTVEKLSSGSRAFDLSTAAHQGNFGIEYNIGNQFLSHFTYDGTATFYYDCGNIRLTKKVAMVYGENKVVISYLVDNIGPAAKFTVTPLLNYRAHDKCQTMEGLCHEISMESLKELETANDTVGFCYSPTSNEKATVSIAISEGTMVARRDIYDENVVLVQEYQNESEYLDTNFAPIDFVINVPAAAMKEISFVCQVDFNLKKSKEISLEGDFASKLVDLEVERVNKLIDGIDEEDDFKKALYLSADQFIAFRKSTGKKTLLAGLPYTLDKGREAMLALPGLLLETGRFDEAKEVLLGFGQTIKNGLIVNEYFEDGTKPTYDAADVSLLFINAVYEYLHYVDSDEAWSFVAQELYPVMQQILGAYRKGTDFNIKMDEDGLLKAGSGLNQVTWMKVKVGDLVATPRHGKAVEINAFWYNAIKAMEEMSRGIAKRASSKGADYLAYAAGLNDLAEWVKDAFIKEFWYEEGEYLYDVVDGDFREMTIRPNQIFAVCMPFTMLPAHMEKAVVNLVAKKLYVGLGVRTLDHDDRDYQPRYFGDKLSKERAYQQGTAWSFLLGPFFRSYLKVNGDSDQIKEKLNMMLEPVIEHCFSKNLVGSINQLFDGDAPYEPAGCASYSVTIAELIIIYNLLSKKPLVEEGAEMAQ